MSEIYEIIIQFLEKNERYPIASELAELAKISVDDAQNILDEYMDSFDDEDDNFVDYDDETSVEDIQAILNIIRGDTKK